MRKRVYLAGEIVHREDASEKLDCTIRALANATALTYKEAQEIGRIAGRKIGHCFETKGLIAAARIHSPFVFTPIIELKVVCKTTRTGKKEGHTRVSFAGVTIKKFIETYPTGNFYCRIRGHAFAVVNGRTIDNVPLTALRKIIEAWRVEI